MSNVHQRRKATAQELRQGEDEMRRAQERMEKEARDRNELPIQDSSQAVEAVTSTEILELEAIVDGKLASLNEQVQPCPTPKGQPVALTPAQLPPIPSSPPSKPPQEFQQVEVRTPATRPLEVVPKSIEAWMGEMSNGTGGNVNASMPPLESPLFSNEQLRQFMALQQQSPWIYSRFPALQAPLTPLISHPGLERPAFLQAEEERLNSTAGSEDPRMAHLRFQERQIQAEKDEMARLVKDVVAENEKLKQKLKDLEGKTTEVDPNFRTPESQKVKEAATEVQGGCQIPKDPEGPKEVEKSPEGGCRPPEDFSGPLPQEPRSGPEQPRPQDSSQGSGQVPTDTGFATKSMEFMVLMMESMKELQRKVQEGPEDQGLVRGVESIRPGVPELPALSPWDQQQGPLMLGDWLILIEPILSELSVTSGEWWATVVSESEKWYKEHLLLGPLERVQHTLENPLRLQEKKWERVERRASSMLLQALPIPIREELVSARRLSAFGVVTYLMTTYSPGGVSEKQNLLRNLEDPPEITSVQEAPQAMRRWMRWRNRAREIGAVAPDPALQLRGLLRMTRKIVEGQRELQFRVSLLRSGLQVDTTPTEMTVHQLACHLQAEFDQLVLTEKKVHQKDPKPEQPKLKAAEVEREDKGKGKGRERSEEERGKVRCRFYLTEGGCRKGKECTWLHDGKDEKRRCYNCGSTEHLSPVCTRPKNASGESSPSKVKPMKVEEERGNGKKEVEQTGGSDSAMKDLLEEANKVLKSLSGSTASGSSAASTVTKEEDSKSDIMERLQQQLNALKQKAFRLHKISSGSNQGLIDSGATHPLRPEKPGEKSDGYEVVQVSLADGNVTNLRMSPTGTMISPTEDIEPIVPMGQLAEVLNCRISWRPTGIEIEHPERGVIGVTSQDGCPQVTRQLALDLIGEIEDKKGRISVKSLQFEEEKFWMDEFLSSHPVFSALPPWIKDRLVVTPGSWSSLPANRRKRKRMSRDGFIAHLFAGEDTGFTLMEAWKQVGGEEFHLLEIDKKRGPGHDLLTDDGPYSGLMRAAMEGKLLGLLGGPACRTRSKLRHIPIPEQPNAPRPVRSWNGGEFGNQDNTASETAQVREDDVLMWRMLFLHAVADQVWKARQKPGKVVFSMEQPSEPQDRPEVVSIWRQGEWKRLKELMKYEEYHCFQGHLGGKAMKPTTFGGTLELDVKEFERERPKTFKRISSSKELERWAPGLMMMVATALMRQVHGKKPKMKALSWQQHIAFGHIPYRKDCKVCQESLQQADRHVRSRHPQGGVLSLDVSGPLVQAYDQGGGQARYMLVGALTWRVPKESGQMLPIPDAPQEEGDPVLEKYPEEEEGEPEAPLQQGEQDDRGEDPPVPPEGREEEGVEGPDIEETELRIFRLGLPMVTKTSKEVTRTAMEMLLRLRADGYRVHQVHADQGHEFSGEFRRWTNSRGIRLTRTPGDDARGNGRAEVSVKILKNHVRRALRQGEVDSKWWPWALRHVDALHRCVRLGQTPDFPRFLKEVKVKKRTWKKKPFDAGVETVKYLCPAVEEHGHWVVKGNDAPRLTRSLMRQAQEGEENGVWLALEREERNPLEVRRRLRGLAVAKGMQGEETGEEKEREDRSRVGRRIQKVIEEEMKNMAEDDPDMIKEEMEIIGKLRKMIPPEEEENEILQTKIVSPKEVFKQWEEWLPATDSEVRSLLEDKQALKELTKEEIQEIEKEAEARGVKVERLPSKIVYTLKPGPQGGKRKVRWVVCGNYEPKKENEETFSSGADATAYRVLIWTAAREEWVGCTLDVRTAFLNAEFNAGEEENVLLVRPPSIFVEKGYMKKDALFQPLKAVYGFRRSPRLWGRHRDKTIQTWKIPYVEGERHFELTLVQLESEPNLWKIIARTEGKEEGSEEEETVDGGQVKGLFMSYVDDLFITGSLAVVEALKDQIQKTWATSSPEWVGEEPVRFLGMEVRRIQEEGKKPRWSLTQEGYISDLTTQDSSLKERRCPITRDQSNMEVDQKPPTMEDIRRCQKEVGELLWIVTRTRPDAMFSVARMGSSLLKSTEKVLEAAQHLRGYLKATKDEGLCYQDQERKVIVNAYADSSFAPDSEESHGAFLILLNGSPVFWRSGRQPSITLSTAESELNELIESMNAAEAVAVMVEEIYSEVYKAAWCDNQSALTILSQEGGTWRTRHLRLRSAYVRAAILRGEWSVAHLPGAQMIADIGTKPLTAQRIQDLKKLMNVGTLEGKKREEEDEDQKKEEKKVKVVDTKNEALENALKVIVVLTAVTAAKGEDDEEDEGRKVLNWMVIGYTILVILVTVLIQMLWKVGVRMDFQGQSRGRGSSRSRPAEEEEAPLPGDERGLDQRDLVRLSPEEDGERGLGQPDLVRLPSLADENPAQEERGEEETEEESVNEYIPIDPAEIEREWDAILREEEIIRAQLAAEPMGPEEETLWESDIGFHVITTRWGTVYHRFQNCSYLLSPNTGETKFSKWCPTCVRVAHNNRGRPPPGVILYLDGWGMPIHTNSRCPRRQTQIEYKCCSVCARG